MNPKGPFQSRTPEDHTLTRAGNDPRFPKHPDGSRDLDSSWTHIQTYQQMERLLHTGKVKMIGVANYSVQFLQELLPHVSAVPAVNQIENHPYLPQQDMVDFCRSKGIHITAYSPLGSAGSPLLQDEHVAEVARRYDVPASAVLLSYHRTSFLPSLPLLVSARTLQVHCHCTVIAHRIPTQSREEARCSPNP